eukprot:SAG25_NODE_14814_length_241_cov_48.852113_1_plen_41_part_01
MECYKVDYNDNLRVVFISAIASQPPRARAARGGGGGGAAGR